MVVRSGWTRDQLLVAFYLYCRLPFGKMHRGNPEIVKYAALIGRTPSALAMKLTNIASLDPAITGTGRKGLEGASSTDRALWIEMQSDWSNFALATQQAVDRICSDPTDLLLVENSVSELSENFEGAERITLTKARIGQAFFRNAVLSAYGNRCSISGLSVRELLVASHIVPWRVDARNRLNPKNGLCLSMLHDKAFDLGLIGVTDDFKVRVSSKIKHVEDPFLKTSVLQYEGLPIHIPEKFLPDQEFLRFHRNNIFQDSK